MEEFNKKQATDGTNLLRPGVPASGASGRKGSYDGDFEPSSVLKWICWIYHALWLLGFVSLICGVFMISGNTYSGIFGAMLIGSGIGCFATSAIMAGVGVLVRAAAKYLAADEGNSDGDRDGTKDKNL